MTEAAPAEPLPARVVALRQQLLKFALSLPEAWEDHPWGHSVVKVRKKIFLFLGGTEGSPGMDVKLPLSADHALSVPRSAPTGYGLGRHGWVSLALNVPSPPFPPLDVLTDWVEESYRAVAPKTLVAKLIEAPG